MHHQSDAPCPAAALGLGPCRFAPQLSPDIDSSIKAVASSVKPHARGAASAEAEPGAADEGVAGADSATHSGGGAPAAAGVWSAPNRSAADVVLDAAAATAAAAGLPLSWNAVAAGPCG